MKHRPIRHRVEYGLYLALRGTLRALPHATARRAGRAVGAIAHRLDRRHREVARQNLALALPELPEAARRRIAAACFRHFGSALCDAISSTRFGDADLRERVTLEGWEHLEVAEAAGRGVFILSPHIGFWEMVPPVVGRWRGPFHIVFRPPDNPWLDRELRALRERWHGVGVPKRGAARRMLEVLRAGGRIGILIDQRVQPREGIEVPFFGRPARTTPVLARLSLRTGAPVVPVAVIPAPSGRYRFVVRPAIFPEGEGEGAVAALTRRYLAVAEEQIRQHPEMWLWMHRRWGG
ncbi:MAG TPA: lysophospholipid acyltransferase family protein [Thermoanaerobaculia bacterium]|nr:lysophospholipid acyltransferase family protein [Thermoanaerobaculia bacterium]